MIKKTMFQLAVCSALAVLAGCGGGDAPGAAVPAPVPAPAPAPAPAPTISMTVTPSLGKVINADVLLKRLDGSLIATLNTGAKGSVTFSGLAADLGAVMVEVPGSASASYFDEAKGTMLPFASGQLMRTALDAVRANGDVAVTALTTAAAARAAQLPGGVSTANIVAANAAVAATFGVADILLAPSLVGSSADLASLSNTAPGQYALKLAALAQVAATRNSAIAAPALAMLDAITKDMPDGVFDGKAASLALPDLPYQVSSFITEWLTAASSMATGANFSAYLNAANFAVSGAGVAPTPVPTPAPDPAPSGGLPPVGAWIGKTVGFGVNGDCYVDILASGFMSVEIGMNYKVRATYTGVAPHKYSSTDTLNSWAAFDNSTTVPSIVSASFTKAGVLDTVSSVNAGAPGVVCYDLKKQ